MDHIFRLKIPWSASFEVNPIKEGDEKQIPSYYLCAGVQRPKIPSVPNPKRTRTHLQLPKLELEPAITKTCGIYDSASSCLVNVEQSCIQYLKKEEILIGNIGGPEEFPSVIQLIVHQQPRYLRYL